MIQGSEEWLLARIGKATASRVHDIIATTRSGGFTSGRKNYLGELVRERLTGRPYPSYQSGAMLYGIETEPEARAAYVKRKSSMMKPARVIEVGFVNHPRIEMAGCSPDGLIDDGLVEIKCPQPAAMDAVLLGEKPNPAYVDQAMFQMACTGRAWCDLVHFDKTLPEEMQLHIQRIVRDDKAIAKMELEVEQFLIDLDATVDLLRKRYLREPA